MRTPSSEWRFDTFASGLRRPRVNGFRVPGRGSRRSGGIRSSIGLSYWTEPFTYCTSGMDPCLPSRRLVDSLRSLKSVRSEARNGRLRRSWRMEFRITSTMPSMMAWQSNHQSRSSCFPGPAPFAPGGWLPADVSSADGSGWRSGDDTRGAWLLARGNCSFTTSTS